MTRARDKASAVVANFASTGIDDNAGANAITINSDGFIGINESSPQNALHITTSDFKALQLEGPRPTAFLKETGATADENFQIRLDGGHLLFQTQNNAQSNAATKVSVLQTGGISFNGDTATANALDDYEEGTWTPSLSANSGTAPSASSTSGSYTKIGRLVTANATITNVTAGGTASAQIQVASLPFTPDVADAHGALSYNSIETTSTDTGAIVQADASADVLVFLMNRRDTTRTQVDNQHLQSGTSDFFFTISYMTNQ